MRYDPDHTAAYLEQLKSHGTRQAWKRNALIYSVDQPAHTMYILRSGQISLQLAAPQGRGLTLQVIEPGQIFGHMALVERGRYDTVAEATRPGDAMALGRTQLRRLMMNTPELALALLKELAHHRITVSRRLDEVAFKSVPARLASLLVYMSDSAATAPNRLPRRTHQQLAEMINAYRETVTKVINQFRAANLLDIDRSGITLLNLSRLREMAQE